MRFEAGRNLDGVLEVYDVLEAGAWYRIRRTLSLTAAVSALARLRSALRAGEEAADTAFAHLAKTQGVPAPNVKGLYEGVD